MVLELKHQTKVQFLRNLRQRYRVATGIKACRIAYRMLKLLADGDVTPVQMQNAWNMTAAEWAAKAAILQVRADKYAALLASEGDMSGLAGD